MLAYSLRHGNWLLYNSGIYRLIAVMFAVIDLLVMVMLNTMHNVLKRGYYNEFVACVKQCLLVFLLMILLLYTVKLSEMYSRVVLFLTLILHILFSYSFCLLWKRHLLKSGMQTRKIKSILLVADKTNAETIVQQIRLSQEPWHLVGIVMVDSPFSEGQQMIDDVPVVCKLMDTAKFICREWVDGVYIACREEREDIRQLINRCHEMGVTVHYMVPQFNQVGSKALFETAGGNKVITISSVTVTPIQMIVKRMMDITGGLIGSLIALIVIAVFAPFIKKASPGPVLYKSERIGLNGKRFKMFNLRSMQPLVN